jgi:hypothetical protein
MVTQRSKIRQRTRVRRPPQVIFIFFQVLYRHIIKLLKYLIWFEWFKFAFIMITATVASNKTRKLQLVPTWRLKYTIIMLLLQLNWIYHLVITIMVLIWYVIHINAESHTFSDSFDNSYSSASIQVFLALLCGLMDMTGLGRYVRYDLYVPLCLNYEISSVGRHQHT